MYTRNGDFSLNSNGLLYDGSSGMAVQGYMAGKNGNITQTGTPGDITIPIGLQSQAVGTGFNANEKFGPSGDSGLRRVDGRQSRSVPVVDRSEGVAGR